jgi:hypothetical protein
MLARLGNVLYWLGCALACAAVALGATMVYMDNSLGAPFFLFFCAVAALFWVVGRACRYVLSGT